MNSLRLCSTGSVNRSAQAGVNSKRGNLPEAGVRPTWKMPLKLNVPSTSSASWIVWSFCDSGSGPSFGKVCFVGAPAWVNGSPERLIERRLSMRSWISGRSGGMSLPSCTSELCSDELSPNANMRSRISCMCFVSACPTDCASMPTH